MVCLPLRVCNYIDCISCCSAGEDIFLEVAAKSALIQSNFILLGFLFIKCILTISHQSTSQKKVFFCVNVQLTLDCFLFLIAHIMERLHTESAWKILDKLQRTEVTHEVLQIQLGLGILSRDGSRYYTPAKIQGLHVWTSELWRNRLTRMPMDCFCGHPLQHVFLDSSFPWQHRAQRSPSCPGWYTTDLSFPSESQTHLFATIPHVIYTVLHFH